MKDRKVKRKGSAGRDIQSSFGDAGIEPPKIYKAPSPQSQSVRGFETKAERRTKQNKKRRLKNSVRKALISIIMVIVFAAVGIVLSLTVFFKTEEIIVSGSGIYSEAEIVAASSIDIGENLFLIQDDKAVDNLTTRLPYIYNAEVKRKLPKTIELIITDGSAAYTIQGEDETYILLDDNFKVLELNSQEKPASTISIQDAAVIEAVPGEKISFENENTAESLTVMAAAIQKVGMAEATAISSIDANNNYILYKDSITFELGDVNNIEDKIYRGLAASEQLMESNPQIKGKLNLSGGKQSYFTAE